MCAALVVIAATTASAQECLHGPGESNAQAARRQQDLRMAQQINLAEVIAVGRSYLFSLKDMLDPCGYAIFSDQDKHIYEATPTSRSFVVPATGR